MAKGKITFWNQADGYGYIQPEGATSREENARFQDRDVLNGSPDQLQKGAPVEFDLVSGRGGKPAARHVRLMDAPAVKKAQGAPKETGAYRFLNPYNFVRYLEKKREPETIEEKLLTRCAPPPHDRYVSLTGRITCEIETVTPVFVSDSHAISGDDHKTYRFFEYDGQPAIPASSLRGMVRSVFEAVTNSCWSVFQQDNPYPLEHREPRAPDMLPARVIEVNKQGATLELLDCTLKAPVDVTGRPTTTRAAAVRMVYPPRVGDSNKGRPFDPRSSQLPDNATPGMRVAALVTRAPQMHRSGRYRSFWAEKVVPFDERSTLQETRDLKKVYGWLHLTGPNIENKHDERLFFRWDDIETAEPAIQQIPKSYLVKCAAEVVKEYEDHLEKYWERNQRDVKRVNGKRGPRHAEIAPQPSLFIEQEKAKRQLKNGNLVYVLRDARGQITVLRPVSMPRMRYFYKRQELLPRELEHCKKYENLCPACRVFGWVHPKAGDIDKSERTAYAGRLQFTHAQFMKSDLDLTPKTLAILSSPKPTTTTLYLARADGHPGDVNYDAPDARLRGRKVYRHQGKENPEEYLRATDNEHNGKDDQNRTVMGTLKPQSKASFTITFENLAPIELGALLWVLQLQGLHHRIGFAKPLGFGSIKITITEIELLDRFARYHDGQEGWKKAGEKIPVWTQEFQKVLKELYGAPEFARLANVRDLKALLGEPGLAHTHYPRFERKANAKGENFKWFVGNKRRKPEDGGPFKLPLADQDKKGFPLLDERGNEVGV